MLIKSAADIKQILAGGKLIGEILEKLAALARPGASAWDIDQVAEKMITAAGGRPSFKGYKSNTYDPPFPCTICASVNHGLVHGIARPEMVLKDGDNISIDIGMEWPCRSEKRKTRSAKQRGLFTDTAVTVAVGKLTPEHQKLLDVTRQSLEAGIKMVKPGNSVADIGRAVEDYVRSQGDYGIVRDLVGHGVGHAVHEEPRVPNYYDKSLANFILKPGMVIAIEPMIALGSHRVKTAADGWTIEMADGSLCAHYEHTVIVTETGCVVATRRPGEKIL